MREFLELKFCFSHCKNTSKVKTRWRQCVYPGMRNIPDEIWYVAFVLWFHSTNV